MKTVASLENGVQRLCFPVTFGAATRFRSMTKEQQQMLESVVSNLVEYVTTDPDNVEGFIINTFQA